MKDMRANMRLKNGHISSPNPFPKVRVGHNASQYVIKSTPRVWILTLSPTGRQTS